VRIEVGGNGFNSNTVINDSNWHHVAVTYSNSASTAACLYVDGRLDTCGNFTQTVNTGTTNGIQIGRRLDQVKHFMGEIDDVRIWNVARSANQINSRMNRDFCSTPSSLVAHYKFEDGVANQSNIGKDSLVNEVGSNNGTLYNFTFSGTSSNWVNGKSLDLNIDTTIITLSDTLHSNQLNASSYQWIDCMNNTIFQGDTNSWFVPSFAGNYAVIVQVGSCIDTSVCVPTIISGIQENGNSSNYTISHNSKGIIRINSRISNNHKVELYTMTGSLIGINNYSGIGTFEMRVPEQTGVYLLRLINNKGYIKSFKVVQE
jgi:hypothetical protein